MTNNKMMFCTAILLLTFLASPSYATITNGTGDSSTNTDNSTNNTTTNTDSNNTTPVTNNTTNNTNSGNTTPVSANSSNSVNVSQNTPRTASTSTAPALTSGGNDSCMGSTSGGAQGLSFGLSLGSTWTDKDCIRRKDATFMHNMGQRTIALAIMCQSPDVRAAVEAVGSDGQKAVCAKTNTNVENTHNAQTQQTQKNFRNHSNGGYNQ
jgi:hypothetical protein